MIQSKASIMVKNLYPGLQIQFEKKTLEKKWANSENRGPTFHYEIGNIGPGNGGEGGNKAEWRNLLYELSIYI